MTDNGPQFVIYKFKECCEEIKVHHEKIPVKTSNKNAHVESSNRILDDECLKSNDFQSYEDLYRIVNDFVIFLILEYFIQV